jgi:hypothetical protein
MSSSANRFQRRGSIPPSPVLETRRLHTGRTVFAQLMDFLSLRDFRTCVARVRAHRDALAVYYLPPYAPERNPYEYLNGHLKLGVAARAPARTKPEPAKAARSHLLTPQHRPDRVRRFFEHPRVTYAA